MISAKILPGEPVRRLVFLGGPPPVRGVRRPSTNRVLTGVWARTCKNMA